MSLSSIKLDGFYADALGVSGTPSKTVTIKNVDLPVSAVTQVPTVGFTTNNTSVIEGNSGTTDMKFTLQLSAGSTESVTVNYTTALKAFGTASANVDYLPAIGSVVFAPGETSKTIVVKVTGDSVYESNESLYVDLTTAQGATIVTNGAEGLRSQWAVGNIINDDLASVPTVGFSSNNTSVKEGNSGYTAMNFTVKLSASSSESVTVNYTTEQKTFGTAKANLDYVPVTGSVVFAAGETSKTVSVKVVGDTVYEANESFYVDLTSATGATIVTSGAEGLRNNWAFGTITNDDVLSVITRTASGIFGTTSKDTIGGTAAADLIYGKGGADLITGFAGNDTFVFSKVDVSKLLVDGAQISDFKDGFDMIGLQGLGFGDLSVVQGTGSNAANTVVSTVSGETLVVLIGINALSIDAADFIGMI